MPVKDPHPVVYATNRQEWRDWLAQHHDSEDVIWLVHFKKGTGQPTVAYEDSVEEAVCFGWIDGKIQRIDDQRYARRFTPRRSGSIWSPSNRRRVDKMLKAGMMEAPGLVAVEEAKNDGSWTKGDQQDDLAEGERRLRPILDKNKKALTSFDRLPPGAQREFLRYVGQAKRPDTIERRINESIRLLKQNKRLGMK